MNINTFILLLPPTVLFGIILGFVFYLVKSVVIWLFEICYVGIMLLKERMENSNES